MQSEWEEAQLWRSGSYIKRHLPHTIISTGFQDPQPGNRSGGGKWAPRGGGERRGSPVGQRFSKGRARRRGQGCAEAQGLKSPGAAALWALGGPGAAEGGGGEAPGKRRPRGLPGRTRRPPAVAGQGGRGAGARGGLEVSRGWGACKEGPCSLQRPGERAGPGGARAAVDLGARHPQPPGLCYFVPRRTPRALPRPTREPRSHHLARRAALAAGGGCGFRGTRRRRRRRRLAVRRRAGCNGAWTRSEAGGVPAGDASAVAGEGGSLTTRTDDPDSLQRLALTATSRHGTGRAEGGASAGRGGAGPAGGRHPGTRSGPCTRSPTGVCLSARRYTPSLPHHALCARCAGPGGRTS